MEYCPEHKSSRADAGSGEDKDLRISSKIDLEGRSLFNIFDPCFKKDTFSRVLFIMTKPNIKHKLPTDIILRRLIDLNGSFTSLDLISTHEVSVQIRGLCENVFICEDGNLPDRRLVTPEILPLLEKSYDAIFLDYHIWQDAPRDLVQHYLIFLSFSAANVYGINASFEIINYHDFEKLYIEINLQEVKISASGILRPECCEELYQSAKIYSRKGAILNIGTYLGRSTIALALGSKKAEGGKVVAIDPLLTAEFYENILKNGVSDYIIPIEMTSKKFYDSWLKLVGTGPESKLGLLFVDGDHTYDAASFDISSWANHLVPGGLLLVDDYERAESGLMRAVYEQVVCSGQFKPVSMPIDRLIRAEKK